MNKLLLVESKTREISVNIDDLFEKYAREYTDAICIFSGDYSSMVFINFRDQNGDGSVGYIVNLNKTETTIAYYLDKLKEDKIEQIDLFYENDFINNFLNKYKININKKIRKK